MNLITYIKRSFRYYRRLHVLLLLGVMVTTIIITGALIVGDSVKVSLQTIALERLAKVEDAIQLHGRYFGNQLEERVGGKTAALLHMRGSSLAPDKNRKVSGIEIYGIEENILELMNDGFVAPKRDFCVLNKRLAEELNVSVKDEILLRIENPGLLSKDASLIDLDDALISIRLEVQAIIDADASGDYSLRGEQKPVLNVFLNRHQLQDKLNLQGLSNQLLSRGNESDINQSIKEQMKLEDYGLSLRTLDKGWFEVTSRRVFIDPNLEKSIVKNISEASRLLTFFVTGIEANDKVTPYSTVTAIEGLERWKSLFNQLPEKNELYASEWLVEDLNLKGSEEIKLQYFEISNDRKLISRKSNFQLKGEYKLSGVAVDPKLMPEIPGLTDADHCREWDSGIPIETAKIRKQDEDYWEAYKGTPKAFIHYGIGREIWSNRFGASTAISLKREAVNERQWTEEILKALKPEMVGMTSNRVREMALKGIDASMDFSGLFIGLSFFLVIASISLTGMFFAFMIEDRQQEFGLLKALGFGKNKMRNFILIEAFIAILPGAILGSFLSILYTKAVLYALKSMWQGAVAGFRMDLYIQPDKIMIGLLSSVIVSLISLWFFHRKSMKRAASQLLNVDSSDLKLKIHKRKWPMLVGLSLFVLSLVWSFIEGRSNTPSAETFFGIGGCLFISLLLMSWQRFALKPKHSKMFKNLNELSKANVSRNIARSVSTTFLIASGIFLVASLGAFRLYPPSDVFERESGTGGFALWMDTATPVYENPGTEKGLETYDIEPEDLDGVTFVPFRKTGGDDASCLNLMRASLPALYGVNSADLSKRKAFKFSNYLGNLDEGESPWSLLSTYTDDVYPAIVDEATMMWNLKMGLGDELTYKDENGKSFKVKLVASLKNSILQGQVIIAEGALLKSYPSTAGQNLFLIDVPKDRIEKVSQTLHDAFEREGCSIYSCSEILMRFNAVQNTYLSIFEVLGSLGLLLGTIGMAIIIFRNVLERKEQLAVMEAIGFQVKDLQSMIRSEHLRLLYYGICIGLLSALVAVLPHLWGGIEKVPVVRLGVSVFIIFLSGLLWTSLASRWALSGSLLKNLQREQ